MKGNKNDIPRARTPEDLDRRFDFGGMNEANQKHDRSIKEINNDLDGVHDDLNQQADSIETIQGNIQDIQGDIEDISSELENKVDKEEGKGLSTNDFTNKYKQDVDDNTTARHKHDNKQVLDLITQQDYSDIKNKKHTHSNKEVLDDIDGTFEYDLSAYKTNDVTNVTGKCIKKNNRVVMNLSAEVSAVVSLDTTLFNLPITLSTQIEFYFWDGSGMNIGTITTTGAVKAVFNNTTNNIIINLCFDTRKEET